MPLRHKSAQKRARQTVKITERNKQYKALIKGSLKRTLSEKNKSEAETKVKETTKILDRAATKGIIHKNKAANEKSKITRHLNSLK